MPRAWRACSGPGIVSDVIDGAITLADIRIAQGRLRDAMRTYEQALQRATEQGEPSLRGTADILVGLSELQRERDDLDAATQHLLRSQELGEGAGLAAEPVSLVRGDGPASGRPRAIWTARSTCSTRRSACTWATSPPTCVRSRR